MSLSLQSFYSLTFQSISYSTELENYTVKRNLKIKRETSKHNLLSIIQHDSNKDNEAHGKKKKKRLDTSKLEVFYPQSLIP